MTDGVRTPAVKPLDGSGAPQPGLSTDMANGGLDMPDRRTAGDGLVAVKASSSRTDMTDDDTETNTDNGNDDGLDISDKVVGIGQVPVRIEPHTTGENEEEAPIDTGGATNDSDGEETSHSIDDGVAESGAESDMETDSEYSQDIIPPTGKVSGSVSDSKMEPEPVVTPNPDLEHADEDDQGQEEDVDFDDAESQTSVVSSLSEITSADFQPIQGQSLTQPSEQELEVFLTSIKNKRNQVSLCRSFYPDFRILGSRLLQYRKTLRNTQESARILRILRKLKHDLKSSHNDD